MKIEHFKAIDDVCAWPNLTLLPDGDIVATIWNQPCHGTWEGDMECWGSTDGGRTWNLRSQITQHEEGTNRFNCATGLTANGDLLTLVSGWSNRDVVGKPRAHYGVGHTLRAGIYRSRDQGFSWCQIGELPNSGQPFHYVPFGDIQIANDGALCISAYLWNDETKQHSAHLFRSADDGYTWNENILLNPIGNETAILHLGHGRWLVASREEFDTHLEMMTSSDDGHSWSKAGAVTKPCQAPGHLMKLHDGKVLLSYGNRIQGECGVEARISEDEGKSWGVPIRIADIPDWDGGYPSSVQRADGMIVTAFYADHPERGDNQYQMDVVIWEL